MFAWLRAAAIKHHRVNRFSWSDLKVVGSSGIATASILIPIFGYFIFFSDAFLNLVLDSARSLASEPSNSEQTAQKSLRNFKIAYLGFWLLGTGTLIFRTFCPKAILRFDHLPHFVSAHIALANTVDLDVQIEALGAPHWSDAAIPTLEKMKSVKHVQVRASNVLGGVTPDALSRREWLEKNLDAATIAYSCLYERLDIRHFTIRAIVASFYIAGSAVVTVPSLLTLCYVVSSIAKHT